MRALPAILALLLTTACGDGDTSGDPLVPEPTLSDIQAKVFTPTCASSVCHDSDGPAGELDLSEGNAHRALTEGHGDPHVLVDPANPSGSFLVRKLRGTDLGPEDGARMPLGRDFLPEETVQAIEAWIAAGAQDD